MRQNRGTAMRSCAKERLESLQVPRLPTACRFHFDCHAVAAGFDYEVHFVSPLDIPVMKPSLRPMRAENGAQVLRRPGFDERPLELIGYLVAFSAARQVSRYS